ncbi:hypothetical protein I4U23_000275 [Adineta vaga]|nr:hypothetical protein I4U23_000275 [Adineta vaga]
MNFESVTNDDEYENCIQDARQIRSIDKSLFCPNFYYVFHAELEIHLNRYFIQRPREQWSLGFVDHNFLPPMYFLNVNLSTNQPYQIFRYPDHILKIVHNAKIKYCCRQCQYEWTTARGRAVFQAELPQENKYNILFAYLFTQICQKCLRDIEPCWYVDEATRVMKNICRILKENFYSNFQSSDDEDNYENQRLSVTKNSHQYNLCQACKNGSCFASNLQRKRKT